MVECISKQYNNIDQLDTSCVLKGRNSTRPFLIARYPLVLSSVLKKYGIIYALVKYLNMRVRHTETRERFDQPSVGFYRTIALSFLIITVVLLGVVVFVTSKKATITVLAKEDAKSVNLTVGVNTKSSEVMDNVIVGSVSSTVVNFSQKYFPTGSKTIEGLAGGEVIVYNKTNEAQILVKTTRLLTDKGILFRLSDKITVPANGQTTAIVYADKVGVDSEIGPSDFTIPGLATDKQKVIFAKSEKQMESGVKKIGILAESDITAARQDFAQKLKDQYSDSGSENNKKIINVLNVNPTVDKKVGDEVDGFTLSGTSTVVVVSYDQAALSDIISKIVPTQIDGTLEKVLTVTNQPKVEIISVDTSANTAQLSVNQDIIVTLDANAEKLSPQYFMGKSKDEIERYVFELNHVAGVQVDFSPGWIGKAPTVPDKIKVVVKDVQ